MRVTLRKLKDQSDRRKKPFAVVDLESAAGWVHFILGGIYDGETVHNFTSIGALLDCLFDQYDGWDVFAHFGGVYDFLFFLSHAYFVDRSIEISPIVPRGSSILTFKLTKNGKTIVFHDSSALFPFGLEQLTKSFGVTHTKGSIDYDKITHVTPELVKYLESDLKGLWESIDAFFNWPLVKAAGGSYTRASQALRIHRTMLKEDIWYLDQGMDEIIRQAYLGGRTEIFRPYYAGEKPLHHWDCNSLYPAVMRANVFPNAFDCVTKQFYPKRLGFYECEVMVPHDMYLPPLGVVGVVGGVEKFIFPRGRFKGMFSVAEINYARSLGVKITTAKGYIFSNGGYLFLDYVDALYAIKERSREGTVDYTIAKDLMTNLYGRYGLHDQKENLVIDDGSPGIMPGREVMINGRKIPFGTIAVELNTFSNVAIAAYVTSYARIYMHRLMLTCGDELYYTDTDSIFTTKEFPVSTKLGGMKLVYDCAAAAFLLPKAYAVRQVNGFQFCKMKGFDKKKIQHFTVDDFYQCLDGELRSIKVEVEPKFATFKTAMRSGFLVGMTKKTTRELRAKYNKREIFREGVHLHSPWNTRPIEVGDTHA